MRNTRVRHFVPLIVVGLLFTLPVTVALAQEGEGVSLEVGDIVFEDGFEDWHDANQRVENDWQTWSLNDCGLENLEGSFSELCGSPEYKQASPSNAYPYRTHGGQNAQQYHTVHQGHHAGVWRRFEAKPGSVIEVHAWGEAWSTASHDPHAYDSSQNVRMQIGVDPRAGSNPASASVVWGESRNPPNQWQEMAPVTVTVGSNGQVSVFLSSNPKYPLPHNDIYWDDVYATYKGAVPGLPEANSESAEGEESGTEASEQAVAAQEMPPPDPILEGMVEDETSTGHPGRGGDATWLWIPGFALVIGTYFAVSIGGALRPHSSLWSARTAGDREAGS